MFFSFSAALHSGNEGRIVLSARKRPVARALCFDKVVSTEAPSQILFSSPVVTRSKSSKRRADTLVVESLVRRCTRSSMKRDGFRPTPVEKPTRRKKIKRQPRKKAVKKDASQKKEEVAIPETPIQVMQQVGATLGTAADKLSEEVLKAPPSTPSTKVFPNEDN